jgi:hypothetical protein
MRRVTRLTLVLSAIVAGPNLLSQSGVEPVVFEEVANARGLRFVAQPGRTDRRYQPETMVAGVALLDYDGDG